MDPFLHSEFYTQISKLEEIRNDIHDVSSLLSDIGIPFYLSESLSNILTDLNNVSCALHRVSYQCEKRIAGSSSSSSSFIQESKEPAIQFTKLANPLRQLVINLDSIDSKDNHPPDYDPTWRSDWELGMVIDDDICGIGDTDNAGNSSDCIVLTEEKQPSAPQEESKTTRKRPTSTHVTKAPTTQKKRPPPSQSKRKPKPQTRAQSQTHDPEEDEKYMVTPSQTNKWYEDFPLRKAVDRDTSQDIKCNICLSKVYSGQYLRTLSCLHFFHALCIDQWLNESIHCPMCRTVVKET